jgi:type I restriction enzyme R subunit
LADQEKRKAFYEYLSLYARALKLSLSSDKIDEIFSEKEINNYKAQMKFYSQLRANIQIRYHEKVDFGKYEKQMQKLLDTFISAKEVNQLTKLVNIFDEEFDQEIERVVGSNAKADSILSASTAIISEKMASNPDYYERLSKRIALILQEYRDKRLSEEEKLKQAKEIREILGSKEAPSQEDYPQSIGQSSQTRAFYDNLKALFWEVFQSPQEEVLSQSVLAIHEIFIEASKKPEWKHSSDMRKQIEGQIEEIFWELEDLYALEFTDSHEILAIIQSIGIHNY